MKNQKFFKQKTNKSNTKKVFVVISLMLALQSCVIAQGVFQGSYVVISGVVQSPMIIAQKFKSDYKREITVDFLVDDKPYQITAEIYVTNHRSSFDDAHLHWAPTEDRVIKNNEISIGGKIYRVNYGGLDMQRIYPKCTIKNIEKFNSGCDFLADDKAIKMINDNNELAFKNKRVDGVFQNIIGEFVYFNDPERAEKWLQYKQQNPIGGSRKHMSLFEWQKSFPVDPNHIKIKSLYIK